MSRRHGPSSRAAAAQADLFARHEHAGAKVRSCRLCGCTDDDCERCIRRTGIPCFWVEADLCSACRMSPPRRT